MNTYSAAIFFLEFDRIQHALLQILAPMMEATEKCYFFFFFCSKKSLRCIALGVFIPFDVLLLQRFSVHLQMLCYNSLKRTEGSSLCDSAVRTLSNLSNLSDWLPAAPRLPHSIRIWNSVLETSRRSDLGWKP